MVDNTHTTTETEAAAGTRPPAPAAAGPAADLSGDAGAFAIEHREAVRCDPALDADRVQRLLASLLVRHLSGSLAAGGGVA